MEAYICPKKNTTLEDGHFVMFISSSYVHTYIYLKFLHTHLKFIHIHMCANVHMHICTHAHTYVYIYV